jgi:altronate hydrolase
MIADMRKPYLQIHPNDNVLVALTDLPSGASVAWGGELIFLPQAIRAKHKFYINEMKEGESVIMYGTLVGKAQIPIPKGGLMTTENTRHAAEPYAFRGFDCRWELPDVSKFVNRTFNGYKRSDGRAGTANYWLFIPTVFCENRNLDIIREALQKELGYTPFDKYNGFTRQLLSAYKSGEDLLTVNFRTTSKENDRFFKNVDGIKFLNHTGGCGGTRQDAALLSALLAAYADHPNVGGVTIMSLGCQHLQVEDLLQEIKRRNPSFDKPMYIFEQQKSQSEEQLICDAIRRTFLGLAEIDKTGRQPCPLSALTIGVKCGGSDGFSGISANPAVGYASDLLVALGGKVLLAEFPELCGAEQFLIDRCVDGHVAGRFIDLMESYNDSAKKAGSGFHLNPSPGNIKDGLITDAMKSAGAAKKGGTSPVVDVLDYTEPAVKPGLSLVCTPGNDVESTTGKTASGAHLILFTTGLGTPTGNPIASTIKISTNASLAQRMRDIIDIDTGDIISGTKTIREMGEEILEFCIRTASGEVIPKAVLLGQDDFIPWKRGVSL